MAGIFDSGFRNIKIKKCKDEINSSKLTLISFYAENNLESFIFL